MITLSHAGAGLEMDLHGEPDETGIPKFVPIAFGRKFASHLEAMIDAETGSWPRAPVERRHYRKRASADASDPNSRVNPSLRVVTGLGANATDLKGRLFGWRALELLVTECRDDGLV